jgi:hypothetical protein
MPGFTFFTEKGGNYFINFGTGSGKNKNINYAERDISTIK